MCSSNSLLTADRFDWTRLAVHLLIAASLLAPVSVLAQSSQPSDVVPGYFNFDLHPAAGGTGSSDQIIFGSAYVVKGPTISGTPPLYNIALSPTAYSGNPDAYSGYLVFNAFTSEATGYSSIDGPINFSAVSSPVQYMGLGCGANSGGACDVGNSNTKNQAYALQLGYDSTNGKGWYINDAAFGFTVNGSSYWVEGGSFSSGLEGLDVHAATRQTSNGFYASDYAGTGVTLVANPKMECMGASPPTNDYCLSLASSQVNPEINGTTLPKAVLLLGSLYLVRRRLKSSP
jgi:hypothetical protein